jgi:sialate O-acetylesterase
MNPDPAHLGWSIAEDSALRSFSAVAYFYAKKIYRELHVPVGVISSAIPGSRIEPWASEEAFANSPYLKDQKDSSGKVAGEPGKFYQTMIAPLAPFALKGFLWYQGETNCFLKETIQYTYKMQALINNWRTIWGNRTLPFYFVQITPFTYSKTKGKISLTEETLPEFREAQTWALKIPYTGMIVTTDLNDSLDNLHPHFKWEIGRRLALVALVKTYGKKEIQASGPMFAKMQVKGNKALLEFNYTGKGLISKDGKALNCFTVAGADGKFVPANAVIKADKVIVSSPEVALPVAVRLGWNEADHPNLINRDGLPAMTFRTNSPLPKKL